jgi:hypothetical protein
LTLISASTANADPGAVASGSQGSASAEFPSLRSTSAVALQEPDAKEAKGLISGAEKARASPEELDCSPLGMGGGDGVDVVEGRAAPSWLCAGGVVAGDSCKKASDRGVGVGGGCAPRAGTLGEDRPTSQITPILANSSSITPAAAPAARASARHDDFRSPKWRCRDIPARRSYPRPTMNRSVHPGEPHDNALSRRRQRPLC